MVVDNQTKQFQEVKTHEVFFFFFDNVGNLSKKELFGLASKL
jgi:hypothetical protein